MKKIYKPFEEEFLLSMLQSFEETDEMKERYIL